MGIELSGARVILSEAKDPLKTCRDASRKGILRFAQDDTWFTPRDNDLPSFAAAQDDTR